MNDWIVSNLQNALDTWNGKLAELWQLVTATPESFKGGGVWNSIVTVHNGLVGVGYALLVLFFAMGVFQNAAGFRELQRPEFAIRHFVRFAAAKVAVGYSMEIMTAIFKICGGIVQSVMSSIGSAAAATVSLPSEISSAIQGVGLLESIPLWLVSLLGSLFVTVMSFILILTVYSRFFKIYMYTALAPLPLASFAGEGQSQIGKSFLRSYLAVCMEGAVIVLACLIFTGFTASGTPAVDASDPAVTMVWKYIGETIFNMLVLVGLVRASDRIAREMFGL